MQEFKEQKMSDITDLISKIRDDTIPEIVCKRVMLNLQESTKSKNYFGYSPIDFPEIKTILNKSNGAHTARKPYISRNSKNFLTMNRKSLEKKHVLEKPRVSLELLTSPHIRNFEQISGIYSHEIKRMEKHIGNLKQMIKQEQ